jgi:acyl carrier protein
MDLKKFIENFAEQFEEVEAAEFNAETNFRDFSEWSSLTALSIIAMVDEEYEVELKGDDIRTSNTVEDIFNIVKGRM